MYKILVGRRCTSALPYLEIIKTSEWSVLWLLPCYFLNYAVTKQFLFLSKHS